MKQHEPVKLDITVQVSAVAIQKILLWTDIAKGEVSALGLIEEITDEDTGAVETLRVTDVFLVNQVCNDCETELVPEAVAELMMNLEAQGLPSGKLRCWVHSHADMETFWSEQDIECVKGLANGEYLLSLVVNKLRQSMMRLDMFHPAHIYLEDVVWEVHYEAVEGLAEQCKQEFKEKVIEQPSFLSKPRRKAAKHELGIFPDDDELWEDYLESEVYNG
ncbi:MAG: hypothetical protein HQ568_04580 [Calditrichaeota bacterium]|nr:hypothetical protein [Calditrichota bacterium]